VIRDAFKYQYDAGAAIETKLPKGKLIFNILMRLR
jgi:hypothetical protein